MIEVAVVEDNPNTREQVAAVVEQFAKDNDCQMKVTRYCSGEELLSTKEKYNLYFLDIEMGSPNGIETARAIRIEDERAAIAYISSHEKYAYQSFSTRPVTYLKKPVTKSEIEYAIVLGMKHINYFEKSVGIEFNRVKIFISLMDILYIERISRRLTITCRSGEQLHDHRSLSQFLEDNPYEQLMMVNQGQAVNVDNIKGINRHVISFVHSDKEVVISRRYQKIVEENYCEYRLRRIKEEK